MQRIDVPKSEVRKAKNSEEHILRVRFLIRFLKLSFFERKKCAKMKNSFCQGY